MSESIPPIDPVPPSDLLPEDDIPLVPSTGSASPPLPPIASVPRTEAPAIPSLPPATQEEQTMGMLSHLLGIFTGFLGPLIIWLIKKDESKYIDEQAKEALNFQIAALIVIRGFDFDVRSLCGMHPDPRKHRRSHHTHRVRHHCLDRIEQGTNLPIPAHDPLHQIKKPRMVMRGFVREIHSTNRLTRFCRVHRRWGRHRQCCDVRPRMG